jgi:L-rhamnose isomerase
MTGVILKDEAEGSWSFTHPDTQDEYFLSFPEDQTVTFWVFDREHCHYRAPTMTSIGFMGCTSAS